MIPASFSPGHGYLDVGFQYGNGRTPAPLWAQVCTCYVIRPNPGVLQYVRHSRGVMQGRRGMHLGINGGLGVKGEITSAVSL